MPRKLRCIVNFGPMLNGRMSGNRLLRLSLMLALLSGCVSKVAESNYKVTMPILQAEPLRHKCVTAIGPTMCKCFVEDDINTIIRKFKAACTALGGTEAECQTNISEMSSHTSGLPSS